MRVSLSPDIPLISSGAATFNRGIFNSYERYTKYELSSNNSLFVNANIHVKQIKETCNLETNVILTLFHNYLQNVMNEFIVLFCYNNLNNNVFLL